MSEVFPVLIGGILIVLWNVLLWSTVITLVSYVLRKLRERRISSRVIPRRRPRQVVLEALTPELQEQIVAAFKPRKEAK